MIMHIGCIEGSRPSVEISILVLLLKLGLNFVRVSLAADCRVAD